MGRLSSGTLICLLASALCVVQANLFSSRLYSAVALNEKSSNVVISPAGVRRALAMLYVAAEGQTADDLKHTLQLLGETKIMALEEFRHLLPYIHTHGVELRIPYRLYVHNRFPVLGNYQHLSNTYLLQTAQHVDFDNHKGVAAHVSAFIRAHTALKVNDIVSTNDIFSHTKLMLVNGFYFRSKWAKPFNLIAGQRPFYYNPSEYVSVPTYSKTDDLLYGDLGPLGSKGVELPYLGSNLTMLIILPNIRLSNLNINEQWIKNVDLRSASSNFRRSNVYIEIPRFRIEYEVGLNEVLKKLELGILYDNPDFNTLTTNLGLSLGNFKHKGIVEVNEAGSEISSGSGSPNPSAEVNFIVNRPFLFAIKDQVNVYFIGRVLNPLS